MPGWGNNDEKRDDEEDEEEEEEEKAEAEEEDDEEAEAADEAPDDDTLGELPNTEKKLPWLAWSPTSVTLLVAIVLSALLNQKIISSKPNYYLFTKYLLTEYFADSE